MEKIKIRTLADEMKSRTATEFIMKENVITNHPAEVISKVNEIIDYLVLLNKLAIRVARLEVYYKQHRKEHEKNVNV